MSTNSDTFTIQELKTAPASRRLTLRHWIGVSALYAGSFLLYSLFSAADSPARLVVGDLANLPASLLAGAAALRLLRRPLSPAKRRAWLLISLGLLAWFTADVIWAGYELLLGVEAPPVSLADPVYLLGYGFLLAGLLLYPTASRNVTSGLRIGLDLIISAGITGVLTVQVARGLIPDDGSSALLAAGYPAMDILLLVAVVGVFMRSSPGSLRTPLGFLLGGVALFLVRDWIYFVQVARGTYATGGPADAGWLAGDLLMMLGAVYQRERPGPEPERPRAGRRWRIALTVQLALPVVAYGFLLIHLLDEASKGTVDSHSLYSTAMFGVLLVLRLGLLLAEQEFRRYVQLVNSTSDAAFVCGADARMKLVNPALLKMVGLRDSREALGRDVSAFFSPRNPPDLLEQIRSAIRQGGWSGEVIARRADGAEFAGVLSVNPVSDEADFRPALVGVARDITEQKRQQVSLRAAYEEVARARRELEGLNAQLEEKIAEKTSHLQSANERLARQNEELQTLDNLKSEFVSLVSHELRAPLTNIGGGLELALTGPDVLPNATRESLVLVQAEAQRLTQFVEMILDVSALEAGRLPLSPATVAIAEVIENVRGKMTARPSGERVRSRVATALPHALADEAALTGVMFHLVDNALKYAPEGEVRIEADAADGRVRVRVTDQGKGIPAEQRELVFEKFHRLHGGDAQRVYGHGLGLYVARRLLRAMEGDIQAGDALEGGAQFTFWLPVVEDET